MAHTQTHTGTLRHVDIGAGGWALETDDGARYTLTGTVPSKLKDQKVTVEGKPTSAMGFMMSGDPVLQVTRVERR